MRLSATRPLTIASVLALVATPLGACNGAAVKTTPCAAGDPTCHVKDAGPSPDAEVPDSGVWGPCCVGGEVSQCYCPPSVICNFSNFTNCGDGTCLDHPDTGPSACGTKDAGPDTGGDDGGDGGTLEACCQNGKISQCYCPPHYACNYGAFTDCGDGTCAPLFGAPDADTCGTGDGGPDASDADVGDADVGDADAGSWDPCCDNGKVTTCYCPPNYACNYGWFTDCGDGTCVDPFGPPDADVCPAGDGGPDAGVGVGP